MTVTETRDRGLTGRLGPGGARAAGVIMIDSEAARAGGLPSRPGFRLELYLNFTEENFKLNYESDF